MSLQHVVLFSFAADLGQAEEIEMRRQVAAWPREIGGMTAIRLGRAIWTERTRGYTQLLYMEFPDEASLLAYQRHPVHQVFIGWLAEHQGSALAFDYALDATTVIHP